MILVNNQPIVRLGLEALLGNQESPIKIVGMAANVADARQMILHTRPDVALIDISLSDEVNENLVSFAVGKGHTRIIMMGDVGTMAASKREVFQGVAGMVLKEDSTLTLIKAIEKVHAGEMWFDRRANREVARQPAPAIAGSNSEAALAMINKLTLRERSIALAFADRPGAQNKAIAQALFMSDHTLRNHLTSVFVKLNISSRYELFVFAKLFRQAIAPAA